MKRDHLSGVSKILALLFALGTMGALIIVYGDVDGEVAWIFMLSYLFLTFFLLLYVPVVTIVQSRKYEKTEIGRKIRRFMFLFILLSILGLGFDALLRPEKADFFRSFSTALGTSFGISFMDVFFGKKCSLKGFCGPNHIDRKNDVKRCFRSGDKLLMLTRYVHLSCYN